MQAGGTPPVAKKRLARDNAELVDGASPAIGTQRGLLWDGLLMGAIRDALQRLQKIERDLNTFRAKEESFRRQIRQARRLIEKAEAECHAHRSAILKCQVDIDAVDLEIKARDESMNRHRQALNAAKSNKEYAAILTALNTEKAEQAKAESRVLALMSQKDELQSKTGEFDRERAKHEEKVRKVEAELNAFLAENRETLERLEHEKLEAAAQLPPRALDTFNRVAEHHEGEALAEVVRLRSRGEEHMCGGCNMSVPLEHVNRLRSRDELLLCSSCGRILYFDESKVKA
jgi:predicted  nucleic acid-binding Zn-ribbon protein